MCTFSYFKRVFLFAIKHNNCRSPLYIWAIISKRTRWISHN
ncbi:Hypothetical protein I595_3271 [Croceitalea dokdonensis DOKDO 023]|uniref:Uncharacterized protein n=1 Tax=Croceitalea dokdonensis DOKDO 023 TaxID=1300341 RepID=A0A0P7AP28_9FLAO|nr:Hypothetical protein I595_3271 [Croceitalea dokdonensis DOKDO 023]